MLKAAEKLKTRFMIRADLPRICQIEAESFGPVDAWSEDDFLDVIRERANIAHVAVFDDRIAGYLIQERCGDAYRILSIAVDPEYRRLGAGRRLVERMIVKLKASGGPDRIEVGIRERNLGTQIFLRDLKFRAVNNVRGYFADGEDLIEFVYRLRKERNDGDADSIRGV